MHKKKHMHAFKTYMWFLFLALGLNNIRAHCLQALWLHQKFLAGDLRL
jgi:hypothetical protein